MRIHLGEVIKCIFLSSFGTLSKQSLKLILPPPLSKNENNMPFTASSFESLIQYLLNTNHEHILKGSEFVSQNFSDRSFKTVFKLDLCFLWNQIH